MSRDLGVARDIWQRNLNKNGEAFAKGKSLRQLRAALEAFPKKGHFLCSILCWVRKGRYPTEAQLRAVNDIFEKHGFRRVACPVYEKGVPTKERMRQARAREAAETLEAMRAARPLLPPGRRSR